MIYVAVADEYDMARSWRHRRAGIGASCRCHAGWRDAGYINEHVVRIMRTSI